MGAQSGRLKVLVQNTIASRPRHQAAFLETRTVPKAPFCDCRGPIFRCDGFNTMPSLPTGWPYSWRYVCPSSKKKKKGGGNVGTSTLCSEPSPAAQLALKTTGAYAETTFPFRISAGAMAFISPLPTMDTTKIEDPRAPQLRGTTQPTCLGTTPGGRASAPAPPPLDERAQCGRTEALMQPRAGIWTSHASERWRNSVMSGWWK